MSKLEHKTVKTVTLVKLFKKTFNSVRILALLTEINGFTDFTVKAGLLTFPWPTVLDQVARNDRFDVNLTLKTA